MASRLSHISLCLFLELFALQQSTRIGDELFVLSLQHMKSFILYYIYLLYFGVGMRILGAMVARLTPDQKVACSIHVGFNALIATAFCRAAQDA